MFVAIARSNNVTIARPLWMFHKATFLVVAWGLVSFGAVYSWGYIPLLVAQLALAALWLVRSKHGATIRPLTVATVFVLLAGLLQLAPVSREWLSRINPAAVALLHEQELDFRENAGSQSISISARDSARALILLSVNLLFALGVAARLSRQGGSADRHAGAHSMELQRLGLWLTCLGSAAALLALAQRATFSEKIYWFWEPYGGGSNIFGSFANRNHFAGWMSLCVCLCTGYWLSLVVRNRPQARTVRDLVLWVGSPGAARLALTACGLVTMVIAVLWSLSRSGIVALAVGLCIVILASLRDRRSVKWMGAGIAVIGAFALWWRGAETLLAWYGRNATFLWRIKLWRESIQPMTDFFPAGSGLNTYERVMLSYLHHDYRLNPGYAHNEYLQLAVEGSLLVGLPILVLAVTVGLRAWRELRAERSPELYWMRMGAATGLVSVAVQSVAEFTLRLPGATVLIALAIGIVTSRAARYE